MQDFAAQRDAMVEQQIAARGIADPHVLAAFREVPRELFVSGELAGQAYGDHPLPIAAGQTISQPYMVALMIAAAEVKPADHVLEVGAGSGYAAAVLSRIAHSVIAIERQSELAAGARGRLQALGYHNVAVVHGDGSCGWPAQAPYDAILVAASGSHVPDLLVDQLAPGGRLVMPLGGPGEVQRLVKVAKAAADGSTTRADLGEVRFVPLIGEEGWNDG